MDFELHYFETLFVFFVASRTEEVYIHERLHHKPTIIVMVQ